MPEKGGGGGKFFDVFLRLEVSSEILGEAQVLHISLEWAGLRPKHWFSEDQTNVFIRTISCYRSARLNKQGYSFKSHLTVILIKSVFCSCWEGYEGACLHSNKPLTQQTCRKLFEIAQTAGQRSYCWWRSERFSQGKSLVDFIF